MVLYDDELGRHTSHEKNYNRHVKEQKEKSQIYRKEIQERT